ncbi:diguanylate cyclase domain-containing protein [Pelomonas sp. KK5]|nr:diguanylate cyclase [Pelomonas sp. KK5]
MTASFGIAEALAEDESADAVLRRADRALYRAKAQGRNVVQADGS